MIKILDLVKAAKIYKHIYFDEDPKLTLKGEILYSIRFLDGRSEIPAFNPCEEYGLYDFVFPDLKCCHLEYSTTESENGEPLPELTSKEDDEFGQINERIEWYVLESKDIAELEKQMC